MHKLIDQDVCPRPSRLLQHVCPPLWYSRPSWRSTSLRAVLRPDHVCVPPQPRDDTKRIQLVVGILISTHLLECTIITRALLILRILQASKVPDFAVLANRTIVRGGYIEPEQIQRAISYPVCYPIPRSLIFETPADLVDCNG